jgi:hypothetical protein
MDSHQPTRNILTLGSRYPRQVAALRVAIGIWLLIVTAALYHSGHAGQWAWLLVPTAVLHFALAYRLLRIARRGSGRHMQFQ